MKTNYILICSFLLLSISCIKEPEASFIFVKNSDFTFENIYFINTSINCVSALWDFGDGRFSFLDTAVIYYSEPGKYVVTLTCYSKKNKKNDEYSETFFIKQPTDLLLEIHYKNKDSTIASEAQIFLYKTLLDMKNYTNKIDSALTNSQGYALIRNLDTIPYYIDIAKSADNGVWANWLSGYLTDTLEKNKINYYPVLLDFFSN